jgi:hypothetical protein
MPRVARTEQSANASGWQLEDFLDSLTVELDKARDTLAVKGVNRPLTYGVQELSLDLQIFPYFDGDKVRFQNARPGQEGASRLSFQLGSITSEQIRRTAAEPIAEDDISLDDIEGLDDEVKRDLRKYGIRSARNLEQLERKNVAIDKLAEEAPRKKQSFSRLADMIKKARRGGRDRPRVFGVSLARAADRPVLCLEGENLSALELREGFPAAMLGGERVPVASSSSSELQLEVDPGRIVGRRQKLEVALDPYTVITMNLNPPPPAPAGRDPEEA